MSLWYPPPLGGAREANRLTTDVDVQLNFPLGCCDSKGAASLPSPGDCRGHLNLLETEEGRPQVTWEPGEGVYFQISDHSYTSDAPGTTHYGGSCQVGFSTNKGQTWKVAASYHGNCPHRHETGVQTFPFNVPTGMPKGPAVFAWVWLNREHESFMNCASVQIGRDTGNDMSSATQFEPPAKSANFLREKGIRIKPDMQHVEPTSIAHQHRRNHFKYYSLHAVERQTTYRHHNPLLKKRASTSCNWASAPTMETSYYTTDASCAANAKSRKPTSDNFEIRWSNACGVVNGDGEYALEDLKCS
jgi:hypothetical protein